MKKICYVATIPAVVHAFLRAHIQAAAEEYEVTVICSSADEHLLDDLNARFIPLLIERKPSPWKDVIALNQLYWLFRRERFDIVHSIMPKAGLLAMLAAWLTLVPARVHTFTGQVWVTMHGARRILLKGVDKLIAIFATCVLVDSPSQRDFLVDEGVLPQGKALVIGAGSICGVDPLRFRPNEAARRSTRQDMGITQDAKVILFVGRLNRDKGMLELAAAFDALSRRYADLVLLLVGAEEDVVFAQIQKICSAVRERLFYIRFTNMPERYMAAADIFCLPSYREGFGMTIIEAAASGIPSVASRIYGITDAVEDEKTGLLFPVGDVDALTRALSRLISENDFRQQMGDAARARAVELFPTEKLTRDMVSLYNRLSQGIMG